MNTAPFDPNNEDWNSAEADPAAPATTLNASPATGGDDWPGGYGAAPAADNNSGTSNSAADTTPEWPDDWSAPPSPDAAPASQNSNSPGLGAGASSDSSANAPTPPRTYKVKGEDIARYGLDYYTALPGSNLGDNIGTNMGAGGNGGSATPGAPSSTRNIVDWTRPPVNYIPDATGNRSWLFDGLGPIANPVAGPGIGARGSGGTAGMSDGNTANFGSNRKNSWDEALANAAAAFPGFLSKGSPASSAPTGTTDAASSFPTSIPGLESATDSTAPLSPQPSGIPGLETTADQTPPRAPSAGSSATLPAPTSAPSGNPGTPATPSAGAAPAATPPGGPASPPAASYSLVKDFLNAAVGAFAPVGPAVGLVAPEAGRRIDNFQRSFAAGVASHVADTLRGSGELLQHYADNPLDTLAPGLSRALGVNSVSGGLPVGRPLQLLGQAVSAIPGVITDPALAQNGEAKAGRFLGGLGAMLFQGYVAPETLVPTLFAQGYAGQYEAAQRQFGANMTPAQEATAHLAGLLGGSINAALGVPFSTYGKAVATFFGAADFGVIRAALDNAAARGGVAGLANILAGLKDTVQASAGADTTAAEAALLPRAVQGLQGVIDTLRTPAFQRAGVIASQSLRDAALGAATQFGQNLVARAYNPQQSLATGVGAIAGQFALLGGLFGVVAPTGGAKEIPAGTATDSASTSANDNPTPGAHPQAAQAIPATIPGLEDVVPNVAGNAISGTNPAKSAGRQISGPSTISTDAAPPSPTDPNDPEHQPDPGIPADELTPELQDYLKRGSFGGKLISPEELAAIKEDLAKQGITVVPDADERLKGIGAAGFNAATKELFLKKDATFREVFHELGHAQTFKREGGPEGYLTLSKARREVEVWEHWQKHPESLDRLNELEREAELQNYIRYKAALDAEQRKK